MKRAALLLCLALPACDPIIGPEYTRPPDATPVEPLPIYETWFSETEACTGETGDFTSVRWFEVPGDRWWDAVRQQYAIGTWRPAHDIFITTAHLGDEHVVKHEIIHELLRGGATDDPRFENCSHITH
jgi:hypothetical protein